MLSQFMHFSKPNQKRSYKEKHFVFITKISDVKIPVLKNSREQKNTMFLRAMILISNSTSIVSF